jgi:hypothetical protein
VNGIGYVAFTEEIRAAPHWPFIHNKCIESGLLLGAKLHEPFKLGSKSVMHRAKW